MARPARRLTPEETLETLQALPPVLRALAVPVYLIAAFWPWWLTFLVVVFLLWQTLLPTRELAWATVALALLAGGGWILKGAVERWVSRGA